MFNLRLKLTMNVTVPLKRPMRRTCKILFRNGHTQNIGYNVVKVNIVKLIHFKVTYQSAYHSLYIIYGTSSCVIVHILSTVKSHDCVNDRYKSSFRTPSLELLIESGQKFKQYNSLTHVAIN